MITQEAHRFVVCKFIAGEMFEKVFNKGDQNEFAITKNVIQEQSKQMKQKLQQMIKRREQINELKRLKQSIQENNFILKIPQMMSKAINRRDIDTVVDLYSKFYN